MCVRHSSQALELLEFCLFFVISGVFIEHRFSDNHCDLGEALHFVPTKLNKRSRCVFETFLAMTKLFPVL